MVHIEGKGDMIAEERSDMMMMVVVSTQLLTAINNLTGFRIVCGTRFLDD